MAKMNSDTANKLIKNLQAEIETLRKEEDSNSTYSYGVNESSPYVPAYSFKETRERVTALQEKVLRLRHAINRFNVRTTLPGFGFTLDEAIGRMSILNAEKKRLEGMLQIPEKTRQRSFGGRDADYICRNFDVSEVKETYEQVCKNLMELQQAINIANLTKQFEVDI